MYEMRNLLLRPLVLSSIFIFVVIGLFVPFNLIPVCFVGITLPAMVGSSSIIFTAIFPLVVIYLAYVNFARSRLEGSLEQILVTPATRSSVFISRMVAGTMVLLISVAVYTLALGFFIWSFFIGVITTKLQGLLLFILFNFLELLSLYLIFMVVAFLSKNQEKYTLLSAILFAVFEGITILGNTFPNLNWLPYFFSPMGISESLSSLIMPGFVNPPPLAFWFIIPL
ncbi:hypothetical protein CM19_12620 [Candidatus Acidianus copahuensis]|uniref:Uncharacterized protein n=1 Tax=Candidatus Acidianus copahuensis TaxID=1160895 RepID=A0A031LL65_9CREN|nr:ABC transporter permease subunit [Candidatus Acidianus copahuensis]EZQ01648.1 hypothetical protein CM19_12620 [Candidatus Acidianus copahuensis]